jgi:uncharacterized protein
MTRLYVSELAIYPVKSLSQILLDESKVSRFGLEKDRRWMVVDKSRKFVTQRQQARMCLVQTDLLDDVLKLSAPGMPDLSVAVVNKKTKHKVVIWEDECQVHDCGDMPAKWLSEFLHIDCRLVYFPEDENRLIDQVYASSDDHTAFSDGFPVLLTSQASLNDLNSKLAKSVPMSRFRPNLVVTGCDAFAEDNWRVIRIGDLTMRVVKPCSRCVIPTIDTSTGKKSSEPIKTLSQYRKRNNKIFFGQNVIANGTGFIKKGMTVEILE